MRSLSARSRPFKTLLVRTLLVVAFVGCVVSVALVLRHVVFRDSSHKSVASSSNSVTAATGKRTLEIKKVGLPIRLKIPSINIESAVYGVGLTPDGAMDVKKNLNNVAWYQNGPRPGEKGSSVIAGHYGWENGKAAVFTYLHKLKKGDTILVEDDKRNTISFVVSESRKYDPKADASDIFHAKDNEQHLNLITCGGAWNEILQTYSDRLVVFADKAI